MNKIFYQNTYLFKTSFYTFQECELMIEFRFQLGIWSPSKDFY